MPLKKGYKRKRFAKLGINTVGAKKVIDELPKPNLVVATSKVVSRRRKRRMI